MQPTPEVLDVLAEYQGVSLPPHRVAQAAQGYASLAAKIVEMRAVPFTFLESVIEPACADRWIENGGRSR
ncbi:MAG: hypothetical protein QOD49_1000 [Actinomycetota bacterium]|jgi:hypothetical protein|nr:hypothetical protein [Actinomycetota bacterium]